MKSSFTLYIFLCIIAGHALALHLDLKDMERSLALVNQQAGEINRSMKYWLPEIACQSCHNNRQDQIKKWR